MKGRAQHTPTEAAIQKYHPSCAVIACMVRLGSSCGGGASIRNLIGKVVKAPVVTFPPFQESLSGIEGERGALHLRVDMEGLMGDAGR